MLFVWIGIVLILLSIIAEIIDSEYMWGFIGWAFLIWAVLACVFG